MPRPSTKPSSSTYINTPKPITPNQITGSQYSIVLLRLAGRGRDRATVACVCAGANARAECDLRECACDGQVHAPVSLDSSGTDSGRAGVLSPRPARGGGSCGCGPLRI